MKYGPGYAQFLGHGLEPDIILYAPPAQSISHSININVVSSNVNHPAAKA